ncbi:MAG: segregation and condensation protein A [Acidimicrobiia bacterium]
MAPEVKTPVFQGPLDLLLQLTARQQVDVMEVSLTDVVDEYLATVEAMGELDLEDVSEFVLVAATLLQLKARLLLPGESDLDVSEELALLSERDRLLQQLLAGATFKDVAAVLAYRMEEAGRFVSRRVGIDQPLDPGETPIRLDISPAALAIIAGRALAERHVDADHLDLELPSVDDAIEDIRRRIAIANRATFTELVEHCDRPVEVVAYFLAVLELARWGAVRLAQEEWLAEIEVHQMAEPDGS